MHASFITSRRLRPKPPSSLGRLITVFDTHQKMICRYYLIFHTKGNRVYIKYQIQKKNTRISYAEPTYQCTALGQDEL
jgi:hypothetical protein